MLNPVCDWICEEVLYTHLILATFKSKFICDQAINPKISLVLVQVMVPYFKAVSQTQAKLYIYPWSQKSDVHATSLQIQSHNLWQNRIFDIKPRSCDSNHIKKLSIALHAIFSQLFTILENTV